MKLIKRKGEILKAMGFEKEVEKVRNGLCPLCSKPVCVEDFKDATSVDEYKTSGICQECQTLVEGYERASIGLR